MIILTGDEHGSFNDLFFLEKMEGLTKRDYVIICGDFGGIWTDSDDERLVLDELSELPFTLLFIDGNPENYDLLEQYPVTEWMGGKVQFVSESVIHLMRGQVYTIGGTTFFTMGGATSHDISDGILEPDDPKFQKKRDALDAAYASYRINHRSWWKQEIPSQEEMDEGLNNLETHGWKVDYILTHCAPTSIHRTFVVHSFEPDVLTEYLEDIKQRCSFKHWYFGHYHEDRDIWDKFTVLYDGMRGIRQR